MSGRRSVELGHIDRVNGGDQGARHHGEVPADWRGPIAVTGDRWTVHAQHGLPPTYDTYCDHALLVEEHGFDLPVVGKDGDVCFVAVSADGAPWPSLVVAQRYSPAGGGCDPGVALPAGGDVVFIGAGERLLAYRMADPAPPVRLWEDACDLGFYYWAVHGDTVLMSAELELAAWTVTGAKLWTMFVEPPWSYTVEGARVRLDMMGKVVQFPLRRGPRPT